MPGSMSRADLVADYKASLHDAASVFSAADDADFKRMLDVSVLAFARVRPRTLIGSVTLVSGTSFYSLPSDFYLYKADLWADPSRMGQPWEKSWPGRLPSARVAGVSGVRSLILDPAPNDLQIAKLGADFRFYYLAQHVIADIDTGTSIDPGDRGLLLLRAQAEAMGEMMMRNIAKPVALRDGLNSTPRNGTPSALYSLLLGEFERMAVL